MDFASVLNNSRLDNKTAQVAPKDTAAANADRFLTMLVAQLKNQDPLNPLDNAQVTTQMAQISTVEGINKLNATLQSLASAFGASQSLQAASMVGRQVLAEGSSLELFKDADGTMIGRGGYELAAKADGLTLTVKDAAGAIVHKAELGKQDAGMHVFEWDGKTDAGVDAKPGLYTFEIAAREGKTLVESTRLMLGRVNGVSPSADGSTLDLGFLGKSSLAGIKHIF
jgi:flagellar basal-body rod modification protein FlgD